MNNEDVKIWSRGVVTYEDATKVAYEDVAMPLIVVVFVLYLKLRIFCHTDWA